MGDSVQFPPIPAVSDVKELKQVVPIDLSAYDFGPVEAALTAARAADGRFTPTADQWAEYLSPLLTAHDLETALNSLRRVHVVSPTMPTRTLWVQETEGGRPRWREGNVREISTFVRYLWRLQLSDLVYDYVRDTKLYLQSEDLSNATKLNVNTSVGKRVWYGHVCELNDLDV